MKKSCYVCGKTFNIKPYQLNKRINPTRICCSMDCSKVEKSERMSGSGNHQYGLKGDLNSSFKKDFRISVYGYLLVRAEVHPMKNCDDMVFAHRLIYEEHCIINGIYEKLECVDGRMVLSSKYHIHHINENKLDNRLCNLESLLIYEHMSYHRKERRMERDIVTGRFLSSGGYKGTALYKQHVLDAGLDIKSSVEIDVPARGSAMIPSGTKISVPDGCVGMLCSRSGLSVKHKLEVGAGIIDVGYTGEVMVHLYNHSDVDYLVAVGDRIAQLITIPINVNRYHEEEIDCATERGECGFGSTGK